MKRINIFAVMLLFAFSFFANELFAQRQGNRNFRGQQRGFWSQLNEEQKQELQGKTKELRDAGKTREEIHAEIGALLQSFGIELPENWDNMQGKGRFGRGNQGGFSAELSADQKQALQNKVKELREQQASREEIHDAVKEMLTGFGIDLPENFGQKAHFGHRGRRPHANIMKGLSEDQKQAIQEKTKEMRSQNATPEEIHAAVGEMLQSFGVELPQDWGKRAQFRGGRGHRGGFWKQLNEAQKEELKNIIKALKENGATKKEVREAVNAKLKEFGIEPHQGRRGNRPNQKDAEAEEQSAEIQGLQAGNYPNPFNPETSIVYTLKSPEKVFIRIFNTNGQLVRTLLNADQAAGTHTVRWDGLNDSGVMATSGIYFYQINAGANSTTQGMILTK